MSRDGVLRAKYLFSLATNQLRSQHPLAPGAAVSLLQDAVEAMAHTVAAAVGADTKQNMNFHAYWEAVAAKSDRSLPYKTEMGDLNQARVGFKHRGVVPTNANKYAVNAHLFLVEASKAFLEIDFESVSEIDAITDTKLRDALREAERQLAEGELDKCLERCKDAADLIDRALNSLLPAPRISVQERDSAVRGFAKAFEGIGQHLQTIQSFIVLVSLGVDPTEYGMAKSILPLKSLGNTYQFMRRPGGLAVNHDTAAHTVRILVQVAVGIQTSLEAITKAFLQRASASGQTGSQ